MRWPLGLLFAVVSACGSQKAAPISVEPTAATNGSMLVLYTDKAFLRFSQKAAFDDSGIARVSNLPLGERTEVRLPNGKSVTGEHVLELGGYSAERVSALKNLRVVAITAKGRFSGRIVEWTHRGLTLATESGVALVTEPLIAMEVAEPPRSMTPGELLIRGGDKGTHDVEITTWLGNIAWRVAYTIVLDGLEAKHATLQGWLAVDSTMAQPLSVEQIAVVDGRSAKVPVERWARYRSYQQRTQKTQKPQQPRVPIAILGRGAEIRGGGSVRLPLFGNSRRTPVELARVFDPVGSSLSHHGATPVFRRNYGTVRDNESVPVSLSIQLDLPKSELARLPAGQVSLFARVDGVVRALGATTGFGQPASQKSDLITEEASKDGKDGKDGKKGSAADDAPKARPGELRIGVAPGLSGRRWQEDFDLDKENKRIVEEIRVELKNSSGDDALVVVHEHLYRGLNWSLAYHNGVGEAEKAAAQEVRFTVNVPANDEVLVMYRVVYSW